MKTRLLIAAAVATLISTTGHATELLTNGGFETGDFTGYTITGNDDGNTGVSSSAAGYEPQAGSFFVSLGAVGDSFDLNQTFADVSGQTYHASYYVSGDGSDPSNVNAYIDGALELALSPVPDEAYTQYGFNFVGSGSDTLTLALRNDPSFDALDSLSVTPVSSSPTGDPSAGPVPDPASWCLMIMGFGMVGATMRRRASLVTGAI